MSLEHSAMHIERLRLLGKINGCGVLEQKYGHGAC
jgi:hypothetical protein